MHPPDEHVAARCVGRVTRKQAVEKVKAIVLQGEGMVDKTPFDSVYKMNAIIGIGGRNEQLITWLFGGVLDLILDGQYQVQELTRTFLAGKGTQRGVLHLLKLRFEAKAYLITFAQINNFSRAVIQLMDTMFDNHSDYRKKCGYGRDSHTKDRTWMPCKESEQRLIRLGEGLVFGSSYLTMLRGICKLSGQGADVRDRTPHVTFKTLVCFRGSFSFSFFIFRFLILRLLKK